MSISLFANAAACLTWFTDAGCCWCGLLLNVILLCVVDECRVLCVLVVAVYFLCVDYCCYRSCCLVSFVVY